MDHHLQRNLGATHLSQVQTSPMPLIAWYPSHVYERMLYDIPYGYYASKLAWVVTEQAMKKTRIHGTNLSSRVIGNSRSKRE